MWRLRRHCIVYDGVHDHLNGSIIRRQLREAVAPRGISPGADGDAGVGAE